MKLILLFLMTFILYGCVLEKERARRDFDERLEDGIIINYTLFKF